MSSVLVCQGGMGTTHLRQGTLCGVCLSTEAQSAVLPTPSIHDDPGPRLPRHGLGHGDARRGHRAGCPWLPARDGGRSVPHRQGRPRGRRDCRAMGVRRLPNPCWHPRPMERRWHTRAGHHVASPAPWRQGWCQGVSQGTSASRGMPITNVGLQPVDAAPLQRQRRKRFPRLQPPFLRCIGYK